MGPGQLTPHSKPWLNKAVASGEDLTGDEGKVVYLSSSTVLLADGSSLDRGAFAAVADQGGILVNGGGASGDKVAAATGLVWALAGAACTDGQLLTNDDTGRLVPATSNNDIPISRCVRGGSGAGSWIIVDYTGAIYPTTSA